MISSDDEKDDDYSQDDTSVSLLTMDDRVMDAFLAQKERHVYRTEANANRLMMQLRQEENFTNPDGSVRTGKRHSSKYRGVYWNRGSNAWRARIWHNGKSVNLGNFEKEHKAALAFDKKARELGRFDVLNFPEIVI